MQSSSPCHTCSGHGKEIDKKPAGSDQHGLIQKETTVEISIPAGVEDGMQLKVSGKGNEAPFDGINGDLLVVISVENHPDLVRDSSNNLHFEKYISFAEAVLGTTTEIPTVDGKVKINLEAGTQSGKTLRLKGKGVPSLEGYRTGDLLVHINVWTPQDLSIEEKQFFENCNKSDNFTPKPTNKDKSFFEKVKEMFG
jgi:molecular chaperone DnaJ